MNKPITLRPATIDDADMLLDWRNDPQTRKASHTVSAVVKDDHITWLAKTIDSPHRQLLIAEQEDTPVGTVRADWYDDVWKLSWTVAPNARGGGVAKRMVAQLAQSIFEPIRAEVKVGNRASSRVAEYANMTFMGEIDDVLHYYRGALGKQKA